MGGWGSGPYGAMGSLQRKRTVEETYCLKITNFKDHLNNESMTCSWNNGKISISIITKGDYLVLAYRAGDEPIETNIGINETYVGFGKRKWFECPQCGCNTARLYIVGKFFKCRECHNLTYLTCQESGDPLDYYALKIRRLQRKLGMKNPEIYELPYFKPKNMHYKTFIELRDKLRWFQTLRDEAFLRGCRRFAS